MQIDRQAERLAGYDHSVKMLCAGAWPSRIAGPTEAGMREIGPDHAAASAMTRDSIACSLKAAEIEHLPERLDQRGTIEFSDRAAHAGSSGGAMHGRRRMRIERQYRHRPAFGILENLFANA